jgi:hypothetical protein
MQGGTEENQGKSAIIQTGYLLHASYTIKLNLNFLFWEQMLSVFTAACR